MEESNRPSSLPARTDRLSDAQAHAVLRRAAELQIEAIERLERQSFARTVDEQAGDTAADGFRREDVEAAALEAGISPEFIRQALIEQDALGEPTAELAPWLDRLGSRLLRTRQRSLELSRTIDAPPGAVLEAMQRVFPAHPYGMVLIDSVGEPLVGGVLVFEIPKVSMMTYSYTSFAYTASVVELFRLHVMLRPVGAGELGATELLLRGDLRGGVKRNVGAGLALSGVGGMVGAMAAAGIAATAGAILPLLAAGTALGFTGGGGASAFGFGAMYRYYLKKMTGELETLLRVVDTNARTAGAFRPPVAPPGRGGGVGWMLGLPE
jgi:hypothetical protein